MTTRKALKEAAAEEARQGWSVARITDNLNANGLTEGSPFGQIAVCEETVEELLDELKAETR